MYIVELAKCFAEVNAAVKHSLRLITRTTESLARSRARLHESARAIRRSRELLERGPDARASEEAPE